MAKGRDNMNGNEQHFIEAPKPSLLQKEYLMVEDGSCYVDKDYCGPIDPILVIPQGVESIGDISRCEGLTAVYIPDSVSEIDEYAFFGHMSLKSIFVDDSNPYFKSLDGVLFDKDCKTLIRCPENYRRISYSVPDPVSEIGKYAFYGCSTIESITIPDSVTLIGEAAFSNCIWLRSITMPDSVTRIEDSLFDSCFRLQSIVIPGSVTEIGNEAFIYCYSLESIAIPDSVTEIGWNAFSECTSLKSVELPYSVTRIGEHAFSGCTSLESMTIPVSLKDAVMRNGIIPEGVIITWK